MYALISSPTSQGWIFKTRLFFLMELMVDNVCKRIQFGLMILVVGDSPVVWVVLSPTCSNCDPVWVLAVDDGQFPA